MTYLSPSRPPVRLNRVAHIGAIEKAADYCLVDTKDGRRVIMSCPQCSGIFYCPHGILAEEPLTLAPSIVGPEEAQGIDQVLAPCRHHFWVQEGEARDIR